MFLSGVFVLCTVPAAAQDDDLEGLEGSPSEDVGPEEEGGQGGFGSGVSAEGEGEAQAGFGFGGEGSPSGDTAIDGEVSGEVEGEIEAEPAPASLEDGEAEEIVVTGSRVKRTNYSLPSAVQVVDKRELQQSGANNMADVVRHLNINYGSNYNTDVSTASGGTSQFNLRGLGLNSTLVLLNGRRLVQSGGLSADGNNFIDVNAIPIAMIERIEILKGGASAIYGSDAVAGVVNIITTQNMNGAEVQVGGQATDKFDQHEYDFALLAGSSDGPTRVHGMLGYMKREPLDAKDRDFTLGDNGIGYNVSGFGNPSAYRELRPNTDPATMATMPIIPTPFLDSGCPAAPGTSPQFPLSFADTTANLCRFNFGPFFMLVAEEERGNLFLSAEHDISDHTHLFFEGGYARDRTSRTLSPSFPILSPPVVPADHIANPTGNSALWLGRAIGAARFGDPLSTKDTQYFDSDTLNTVAGIRGDFGGIASSAPLEDWEWELSGSWGVNRYRITLHDTLRGPLNTALNSCVDGVNDIASECFNPFSTGPITTQVVIDKITGKLISLVDTTLVTGNLQFSGPLVELPGGDLGLAFGAQIRREDVESYNDHDSNQQNFLFLVGTDDFSGDRTIVAGYGELDAPLLNGLELEAAGRIENYDDVGSTFDPKLGFSWTPAETFIGDQASPVSKIRLRGTFATSFRAPSLLQTNGSQTELQNIFNTRADPMTGAQMRPMTGTFVAVVSGGNPMLSPETSTAITAGLEWMPVEGLRIDGDYFRYDYQDIIVKQAAQQLVDADYQCTTTGVCNAAVVVRTSGSGTIERVNTQFINAREVQTDGIDLTVDYRSDFGANAGTFSFGIGGTYLLSFAIPVEALGDPTLPDLDCSGGTCDVAGSRNNANFAPPLPRLRASVPIGWSYDIHSASLVLRYTDGYKNDSDVDMTTRAFGDIDPMFMLDLQYSVVIEEGDQLATTLKLGVLNLLDAQPPLVPDGYGYDAKTHDPRGRLLYARIIQDF